MREEHKSAEEGNRIKLQELELMELKLKDKIEENSELSQNLG